MNLFQKYGIKEVADVVFYSITSIGEEEFYTPVLFLDTLKVSTLEKSAEKVEAKGGKGNKKLITWNFGKEITLNLEDALFSPASMGMIWGGKLNSKLSDYTSAIVKGNLANKYGELNYSVKAYPSPALTNGEWEVVFKYAHELGINSGSENEQPFIYLFSEDEKNQAFVEQNRQSLISKYFRREWQDFDFSFSELPVENVSGIGNTTNFLKLWLGEEEIKGFDAVVKQKSFFVEPIVLIRDFDKNKITFEEMLLNENFDGNYYVMQIPIEARYRLKKERHAEGWYVPNKQDRETTTTNKDEAIFIQKMFATVRYKKNNNKIIIKNNNQGLDDASIIFEPVKKYSNTDSGYPQITYLLEDYFDHNQNEKIVCSDNASFLKTYFKDNIKNIIVEDVSPTPTLSSEGEAISPQIIQAILEDINSIDKIGYIETDIIDIEVIDRMEKCIVKDKRGLKISTKKQKENLFKYYADDRTASYTIYYDAKTMLPLFHMEDGIIKEDKDEFTLKLGTIYYKWTRTVKYKESDDDAILGKTLVIDAETFPDAYKIVGETYIRNQKTGKDQRYQFTIHRATVSTDTSVTLEAEGDPTTFSMQIDVLTPPNDIMMELKQYDIEDDPIEGGTRIVPQKSKYTYTPTNIEYVEEVADKNEEIY